MKMRMIAWILTFTTVILLAQDNQAPQNLLKNPGFEAPEAGNTNMPAAWGVFAETGEPSAFTLVTNNPKEGASALKLAFGTSASKFYGVGQRISVKAGQVVTFTAYVRNVSLRDKSYAQLSIEWVNGDEPKKEISRSWGPVAKAVDVSADSWKKFEMTAVAPAGAVEMNIVVTLFPAGNPDGAILIDDLTVDAKESA